MKFIRFIFALALGIITFSFTVAGVESVGRRFYPPPPELEAIGDRLTGAMTARDQSALEAAQADLADAMATHASTAPVGAFIFVVVAWIIGAFVGGGVAAVVTPWRRLTASVAVGLADVAAILLVTAMIPGPGWMRYVGMTGSLIAAYAVGIFVARVLDSKRPSTLDG